MTFLKGVVEGFYGREWSWELRSAYVEFLVQTGLNSYLYCPKADPFLRRQWSQSWPETTRHQLRHQAEEYRAHNLNWGVGLSPYALYQDYSAAERTRLREKLRSIDDLGGNILAILFDDMPGDCPDLALRQAEIVSDAQAWSACEYLVVCPTYYSFDPQLQRYFGDMPGNYWQQLGAALPREAGIMWTGNQVCSASISRADIRAISRLLGRQPLLWDNYPVNDGEKASGFLHLTPLSGRETGLESEITGHFCNPMNQGWLSRYPLAGLASLYGGPPPAAEAFFSPLLCQKLERDLPLFEERGLMNLAIAERQKLASDYAALNEPAAHEIADWLRGGYRFDPACLTD